MVRYAGIEAGGTTWVVAIAQDDPTNIVDRADFKTTTPSEVIAQVIAWLTDRQWDALGVASFGPIDLDPASDKYGYITTTPKVMWRNADILGPLRKGLGLSDDFPIGFDTDVNAPAMAEYAAAQDNGEPISSCAYVTVGTGVGIGLVFNGNPVHGLLHGEGGHMSLPLYPGDDFDGKKSLNCKNWYELESMTNSAAIAGRAGVEISQLKDLPDEHPVWDIAAHYMACMCANMILMVSPEKIVLSGGVMLRSILFPKIRAKTQDYLNGYINVPAVTEHIDQVIVPSSHKNQAGIIGALYLAKLSSKGKSKQSKGTCPAELTSHLLFGGALIAFGALIGAMVARSQHT